MRRTIAVRTILALAAAVVLAAACKGPEVPSPYTGTTHYLCCNIYYEKAKMNDATWIVGTKVPFGTRVHVEHVFRNAIEFTPEGHPTITLAYKYGEKAVPFETYLSRLLVDTDPHTKLRKVPQKRVEAIEQGLVEPGMTRDQVMMARGIPPGHKTPALESPTWTYWRNHWDAEVVYFVGDKVERVGH
jgi:hypothetical protein